MTDGHIRLHTYVYTHVCACGCLISSERSSGAGPGDRWSGPWSNFVRASGAPESLRLELRPQLHRLNRQADASVRLRSQTSQSRSLDTFVAGSQRHRPGMAPFCIFDRGEVPILISICPHMCEGRFSLAKFVAQVWVEAPWLSDPSHHAAVASQRLQLPAQCAPAGHHEEILI